MGNGQLSWHTARWVNPTKKSLRGLELLFDFGGRFRVDEGRHECFPGGEDEIGGNCPDMFEEALSGSFGLARLGP